MTTATVPPCGLVLLGILIAQDPGRIDRRSPTLHRLMVALLAIMTRRRAVGDRSDHRHPDAVKDVTATVLLGRGAAIWVENMIVFSLWYWQLDRGGPAERAAGSLIPRASPSRRTPPPS